MAQETQRGTAIIHGIDNSGSAITISGYATFLGPLSANVTQNFDEKIHSNGIGAHSAWVTQNEHNIVRIRFKPSGATRAAASAVAVFVGPLATVTLANFKVSVFNGAYQNLSGATIDLKNEDAGELELNLRKYTDATQNTAATGSAIVG